MKLLQRIQPAPRPSKQRKFLRDMYKWISLAMLLPLTLFGIIAYYNSGQAVLGNEYQANKKILMQVKYNIDSMDDMILNSVFSIYNNPDVRAIMYNKDVEFADIYKSINTLRSSIVNTNPFIRSVYIYNSASKSYYTTLDELMFKDASLETLFQSGGELPILKPVPRRIDYMSGDKKHTENVVSYFMYEFKDQGDTPAGALIFNANTTWLLENIANINAIDKEKQDKVMILDEKRGILGEDLDNPDPFLAKLRTAYEDYNAKQPEGAAKDTGYYIAKVDGKKYLVTFTNVEKMNWTLVKAQLYDEVFQKVERLKTTFVLLTAAFLLIAFLITVLLSRTIYRPIRKLVNQVSQADQPYSGQGEDEFSYLNQTFQHSFERIQEYRLKRSSENEALKAFFLRRLLVDSPSVSGNEFDQALESYAVRLNPSEPLIVCVVKIDDYALFQQKFSLFDQALCSFGITNIASECIGYPCETVEMKNDYLSFIMNANDSSELIEGWKQAQHYIQAYYHISISVSISGPTAEYAELSERHFEALNQMAYRLLYGKSSILTGEAIRSHEENVHMGYSAALEKKLVEALRSGSPTAAEEALERLFGEIQALSYNNALLSVMSLINTLKSTVDGLSRSKLEPVRVNFNLLTSRLFEAETLQELKDDMTLLIRDIFSKTENIENEKQAILVDAVKELIEVDYANPALCLALIADKLNLSSKSVSKLFSTRMNMSVADYLNELRLNKAVEWLESTSLSIKEILLKIGIENESYFYKLFKKKFGATPKEYVQSKSVKQIQGHTRP
ncbi:helix-turn-helix domain-containing protein [Paenibacillus sacheonensis]|uniref:Helix-turn-helix domain-containing protein n=1 Tax=Paenibacillus sacheonensis TaxID=742054 RepID=A0A7X5C0V2_9BACL|nr:helix-turn-helix domain-containing protein [Paenibacillus sacheonensis]MBM7565922.1 AraC-like DNA-binding protein [Paenibacillus sacheonensis]NBC68764.1 helix-turn-helix domain-containing protein [Paenibacillus sacheonensis]